MLSQSVRVAGQAGGIMILSRLLAPQDFGTMAMAMTALSFATLLRELGVPAALIQRHTLEPNDLWTAFVTQTISACILGLIFYFAAPATASIMGSFTVIPVMRWMALSFPLIGLGNVQQALLEREGRFRKIACVEIAATLAGLVTAVLMAASGHGVISLAFQSLVTAGIGTGGFWLGGYHLAEGRFKLTQLRGMLNFGGKLTLFNLVNFFARNTDNFIIGRQLGQSSLGLYSQAYKVMLFPVQNLTYVVGRSLYPSLCKDQDSTDRFWSKYLKASGMVATASAPVLLGIITFRQDFVHLVFGPQWGEVAPLLLWLGPTGCIQALVSLTGTAFMAKGRTDILLSIGIVSAFTQITGFVIGIKWGLHGLVELYLLSNLINASFIFSYLFPLIGGTWKAFLYETVPPYGLATGVFLGFKLLSNTIHIDGFTYPINWITALLSLTGYFSALYMLEPRRMHDFHAILSRWSPSHQKGQR